LSQANSLPLRCALVVTNTGRGDIDQDAPDANLGHRFYCFYQFSQAVGLVDEGKILDAPVSLA